MRNVLIVSPNFPPVSTPDMHRVRMSLSYFREFGWEPIVLCVAPSCSDFIREPELVHTYPADVEITRTTAIPRALTHLFGLNDVGIRAFPFLYSAGARLIRKRRIDLAYFSTTNFYALALGRLWWERFSLPYVLDIQDPWVTDYYEHKPKCERPPKYRAARLLNKILEAWTMRRASGLIAVSEAYHRNLCRKYPGIQPDMCRTIPFAAYSEDFRIAEQYSPAVDLPGDAGGIIHGVYIGVLGQAMTCACRIICEAFRRGLADAPALFERVRLHFIGTDYASPGREKNTMLPIAQRMGLGAFVSESPLRIPYLRALTTLRKADFLLVPGTDDSTYTASKIYPYIAANRPLLAVFHQENTAGDVVQMTSSGAVVRFCSTKSAPETVEELAVKWRNMLGRLPYTPSTDWESFQRYTAREMTRQQCELFDLVLPRATESPSPPPSPLANDNERFN